MIKNINERYGMEVEFPDVRAMKIAIMKSGYVTPSELIEGVDYVQVEEKEGKV